MKKDTRYVGFDVDSEKIAVAVAEPDGEVRSLGEIPNQEESVGRLVRKLGPASRLRVCYEAGPHGFGLYHDGEPQARSANIRVINRRASPSTAASPIPRVCRDGGDNNGRAHWT